MMKSMVKSLFNRLGVEVHRAVRRDPFETQKMLLGANEADVVFDIGAFRGSVAGKYSDLFPKAIIYCFEPSESSYRRLKELYGCHQRIKTFQTAVGDRTGRTVFYLNSDASCNSLLQQLPKEKRYSSGDSEVLNAVEVDVITLDDFCKKESISRINVLKMDAEGAELSILKGASELLKRELIDLIYTEVMFIPHYKKGTQFFEQSSFLYGHGYTLFDLYDIKRAGNGQIRWGNAIFISSHVRAETITGND